MVSLTGPVNGMMADMPSNEGKWFYAMNCTANGFTLKNIKNCSVTHPLPHNRAFLHYNRYFSLTLELRKI